MDLNLDLNNLDFNEIGRWPPIAKAVVILVLCALTLVAGYYVDIQAQLEGLDMAEGKEQKLKKDFESKYAKVANLDAYKQQMAEMEESFGTMLRQLPSKTEVAELLVDITQTGLASGLEFELFQPKPELQHEFYAELPISVRVVGDYHQFGRFVSGVASLPRIVTLHDITINKGEGRLVMAATAKTYRYLDDEEIAAVRAKAKEDARKRRR